MEGEEFNRLKESIRELDILTPLRVSADMTIISGHQRYRAAKELGFKFLPVIVDEETISEDEKKLKLIASNFQRIKHDPVRQARWIAEYERLCGVRHGGDRKSRGQNVAMVTQTDIANKLGVNAKTIQRLKKLNDLIPEFADMVTNGRINKTDATNWLCRLGKEQQQQLWEAMPEAEKYPKELLKSFVEIIQEGQLKEDELRQMLQDAMISYHEVTNRKGDPTVSDDEAAPRDGEKDNYHSYLSVMLHYNIVDNTECLSTNKEQIKKFKPDALQQPAKDALSGISNLSEVLFELVATIGSELENPVEVATTLEALAATYTKLSEQLRK